MNLIKKYWWLLLILAVIVLALAYKGRHRIKSMLGLTPAATPMIAQASPTSMMAPTDNIYTAKDGHLADFAGMSLYTYDKDTTGVSNCTGACLVAWPVYTSGATAESPLPTNISVVTDANGTKQFAWKGMPLYYYAKDKNPGDTLGDGIGGIWHLVIQK